MAFKFLIMHTCTWPVMCMCCACVQYIGPRTRRIWKCFPVPVALQVMLMSHPIRFFPRSSVCFSACFRMHECPSEYLKVPKFLRGGCPSSACVYPTLSKPIKLPRANTFSPLPQRFNNCYFVYSCQFVILHYDSLWYYPNFHWILHVRWGLTWF